MIKVIKFILPVFIAITCFSCNNNETEEAKPQEALPNSDFETWQADDSFEKPENWSTSNFSLYGIVTFNTVVKDNLTPYEGEYCPKLETKSQIIDNQEVKMTGLITLGRFDVNIATRQAQVTGGIPFISKPASLEGYYKYIAVGIDSCFVDIALTKFNSQLLKRDTIASGRFSSSSVSDWTSFDLPIKYFINDTPDSMNIIVLSSDTSIFESGSTLWIDKLSLKY
ncbi:MAG: PCMD domain-containing protein [Bacteroidales bacterium]|nr:PCMD domain-containing protein [Bacteroidales bacterium]